MRDGAYGGWMTDAMILLPTSIDLVSEQVEATTDDGWSSPSPCEGWSALDVLAHATGTLQTAIGSMGGGDPAAAPADAANASAMSEVVTQWEETAAKAADTIVAASPDQPVSTPDGEVPLSEELALPAADLAVHAWDLAAAGGRRLDLPDDLIEHVERVVANLPPAQLRSNGLFGPEVDAPADASRTEKLMAYLGRRRP